MPAEQRRDLHTPTVERSCGIGQFGRDASEIQAIASGELPLSIGGGIGQSRTFMLLLQKAHIGEVSVSVWPEILKQMCRRRNIHVLE